MRMLCPVTCGCADRLSGQALLAPEWGCPSPCAEAAAANLATAPCEDTAPSEAWRRWSARGRHSLQSGATLPVEWHILLAKEECAVRRWIAPFQYCTPF